MVLAAPGGQARPGLGVHRLGVDRDEDLRPAEAHGLGAERRQGLMQQIPRDRAVLPDADAQPRQRARSKAGHVALRPGRPRAVVTGDLGCCAVRSVRPSVRHWPAERGDDRGLVGLADLARGHVELQPVAVGGDVAAGHHHRGQPAAHRRERQRRRRHLPHSQHRHAGGGRGGRHPTRDGGRGGAQVLAHGKPGADLAGAKERPHVIGHQIRRQLGDEPAQPAGAEFRSHRRYVPAAASRPFYAADRTCGATPCRAMPDHPGPCRAWARGTRRREGRGGAGPDAGAR